MRHGPNENPSLTTLLRWFDDRSETILVRLETARVQLEAALQATEHQLVFGDFNATNVLFDSDGSVCGITDYEDLHHGPRELDVLTHCMFVPAGLRYPARLDDFLRAYGQTSPGRLVRDVFRPIAQAIVQTRLVRAFRAALSRVCLVSNTPTPEILARLEALNQLCLTVAKGEYQEERATTEMDVWR